MKTPRTIHIGLVLLCMMTLTSCDFLRSLAGRPTSSEIAAMKSDILQRQELEKQRLAAIEAEKARRTADSLELAGLRDSLASVLRPIAEVTLIDPGMVDSRYYVITGIFSNRDNAVRQLNQAKDKGLEGILIPAVRKYYIVGLCPTDDFRTICNSYSTLRTESFCPPDAWILLNE